MVATDGADGVADVQVIRRDANTADLVWKARDGDVRELSVHDDLADAITSSCAPAIP
jgi:hypothetical protein